MLATLLPWIAILAGFVGLIYSAHYFVEGSAAIANNFGIPKLIIGLTIVAFGTSAPEVIVSISSALNDAAELAVGNAIGSNLANIGLVLGVTALIAPLPVKSHILKQEFPLMLVLMLVGGYFLWDAKLTVLEGLLLVLLLIPVMVWIFISKKQHPEEDDEEIPELASGKAAIMFVLGLAFMILSAEILVYGAKTIAMQFNVSPVIVGLTVVALGTSLPELAASVSSALKGHHDIAIGNILGSNIFNLLLVMGIPALIDTIELQASILSRDYLAMTAISLLLGLAMLFGYWRNNRNTAAETNRIVMPQSTGAGIGRTTGVLLLLAYAAYYFILFQG